MSTQLISMRGSRLRFRTVPGEAIFANKRCASSCTRNELFGERLGLPSGLVVAAKHRIVPSTITFISVSKVATGLPFQVGSLLAQSIAASFGNVTDRFRNGWRKYATQDRLG